MRLAPEAAVFAGLFALAVYATWPTARYVGSRVPGLNDTLEAVWIFAWAAHAIVHQPFALFNGNIFSPEPYTLAYAENLIGVSLPAAPIFWITNNAILTYQLAMLAVLAVGGFGAYLIVRELGGGRAGAVLAGAAYTCAPYRLVAAEGVAHPHVVAMHVLPFVLLVLLRLRRGATWGRVVALGLLIALQWWSSLTGGVLTMAAVGAWGVWEALRLRLRAFPVLWRAGVGIALGLVLTLPVLVPYVRVRSAQPGFSHDPNEALLYSARPRSYLSPVPAAGPLRSLTAKFTAHFADPIAAHEKTLFPGFWVSGLFVLSVVFAVGRRIRGPSTWFEPLGLFLALGLAGFLLSLGPRVGGHPGGARLPFAYLDALVPGSLIRVPARMGVLVLLAMAVVVGIAVARLPSRAQLALVALSVAFLMLELAPTRQPLVKPPPITAAHTAVAGRPGVVLALPTAQLASDTEFVPFSTNRESLHMYLSTAHFRPLTNGYGAFAPSSYYGLVRAAQALPSPDSFRTLQARNVRTVIVQSDFLGGTVWAGIEPRLAAWPGVREIARAPGVVVFDVSGVVP